MPKRREFEHDLAAIRAATARLLVAVNGSDVPEVLALWADDGVLMPPGHPAVCGQAALEDYFSRLFAGATFTFAFTASEIELAGDAAFERVGYTAVARPTTGASPIEEEGKGLHVYRRQPDGAWRLALDIWNSDGPPASTVRSPPAAP